MSHIDYQEYHPFRKDMIFKTALLRSGEKILFAMDKELSHTDRNSMKLIEPVVIDTFTYMGGSGATEHGSRLRPWMNLSDSDEYVIPTEFIIAMGDMRPDVKSYYLQYAEDLAKAKAEVRHRRETITLNEEEEQKMEASIQNLLGRHAVFVDEPQ